MSIGFKFNWLGISGLAALVIFSSRIAVAAKDDSGFDKKGCAAELEKHSLTQVEHSEIGLRAKPPATLQALIGKKRIFSFSWAAFPAMQPMILEGTLISVPTENEPYYLIKDSLGQSRYAPSDTDVRVGQYDDTFKWAAPSTPLEIWSAHLSAYFAKYVVKPTPSELNVLKEFFLQTGLFGTISPDKKILVIIFIAGDDEAGEQALKEKTPKEFKEYQVLLDIRYARTDY